MSSCKASFVSILNNDDNPSFAVRSAPRISRHYPTPSHPYQLEKQPLKSGSDAHYGNEYSGSSASRIARHPFDPVSEATQPTSPGSSDCSSYEYMANTSSGSYHHPARHDPHVYPPPAEKRLSANSVVDPPSPQASIGSTSKESVAPKGSRKNKYPCPFSASHGCTATFTTSGHAARHGKKHTGEKSVHCPICNKAFTRKDNMKQHIRTHRTHSDDVPTATTERDTETNGGWTTRSTNQLYDH